MKYDLEPAKKVLRSFLSDIKKVNKFRAVSSFQTALSFTIKDKMPEFEDSQIPNLESYWTEENAYMWLYADPWDFRSFMHIPKPNPISEYYFQDALPLYLQWRQEDKEVFNRNCEMIPFPDDGVPLIDYLQQLALSITEENEHRDVWVESLRSFLQFLRDDTALDQKGPLEGLFPSHESCKGMELRRDFLLRRREESIEKVECHSILRNIENTVYPIDILAASEILMNLSQSVLEDRPNSQRSAAEALGFAWLCHAVGCYRLVTRQNLVFSTELSRFRPFDLSKPKERYKPTHFIGIISLFGVIDIPVSKALYEFLLVLPRDPNSNRVFNMDWETVLRTFRNKGVKQSKRAENLGQITFQTFMSQPHHAIGHRPLLSTKS